MKRILFVLAVLSITLLFGSCANKNENDTSKKETQMKKQYVNITAEEAKKIMDTNKEAVILDVRTKEEYREKHIPGSTLIPVDVLEKEAEGKLSDKEKPILVYCRSGNRSLTASKILVGLGYQNVYNFGGIMDWKYKTESGDQEI